MEQTIANYLLTDSGRVHIAEAAALLESGMETLQALTRLRKTAGADEALACWEQAALRRRAVVKFGPDATRMFFVREALEQASSAKAAAYHAQRFVAAGVTTIADLCGGIGGDSLAFARAGLRVDLYESDPVRAQFAAENARACGFEDRISVQNSDVTTVEINTDAAWFDPARRDNGRRVKSPENYSPPLSFASTLHSPYIGIKISPATDHEVAEELGADLEFLSDNGECKEALLWLGAFRTSCGVRATILTESRQYSISGTSDNDPMAQTTDGKYLFEPDPAVIRSHLVGTLARQIGAAPFDPQIAYLLGDRFVETPFATCYEIIDRFPFHKKTLQRILATRGIGSVVIKKRGFPFEPDDVRKGLKLTGPEQAVVVLTRHGNKHLVFLCRTLQETLRRVSNGDAHGDIGVG